MKDLRVVRALSLRQMLAASAANVVAVAGGAERVGCTAAVVHLAIALSKQGLDVLVVDEGAGGRSAGAILAAIWAAADAFAPALKSRLPRVLAVERSRLPVAITGEGRTNEQSCDTIGYDAVPASTPDVVLIDAALSDGGTLSPLALQAHDVVLVTTMTADAVANTYVRMKRLRLTQGVAQFRIVMNQVGSKADAYEVLESLGVIARDYLAVSLLDGGCIRADPCIARAAVPDFTADAFPSSPAADDFASLATDLQSWPRRPAGSSCMAASTLPSVHTVACGGRRSPFLEAQPVLSAREASKGMCGIYKPRFN